MTTEPDDALLWALEHYEHDLPGTVGAATKAYRAGRAARDAEVEALRAENERLRDLLTDSTERMEKTLAAMDKYNEANGTHIIGPSLLGLATRVAGNRAALGSRT